MDENLKSLFIKVIEDNKQKILRICRVYASDKEDQKDMYQEVVLNIWKSLPSFGKESKIDTWIYRICLNVCMQYALKLHKSKLIRVDIEGINISDESAQLCDDIEAKEATKKMYECISRLKHTEKSLILLFLEDVSYKIISEITGLTENHVAVKLGRIKRKLFNCINN